MSMTQYALHRGVSRVSVFKAIGKRIHPTEEWEGKRKEWRFDPITCDADWIKNTKSQKSDIPAPPEPILKRKAGRPTKEQAEARAYLEATLPRSDVRRDVNGNYGATIHYAPIKKPREKEADLTDEQKEAIELARRKNIASTEKLEADAMKSRIEVEKDAGQLAYIEDIEDLFSEMVIDARDRFMSLTSVLKIKFSDLKKEHLDFINSFHMEIFMSLSRKNERQVVHIENRIKDK